MPDCKFIGLMAGKAIGRVAPAETQNRQENGQEGYDREYADGSPPVVGREGVIPGQIDKPMKKASATKRPPPMAAQYLR